LSDPPGNTYTTEAPFHRGIKSEYSDQTRNHPSEHPRIQVSNLGRLAGSDAQHQPSSAHLETKEGSQSQLPGDNLENSSLGNDSTDFHELQSSFLPRGPADIEPIAFEDTDVWPLPPSGLGPVEDLPFTLTAGADPAGPPSDVPVRLGQQTSLGLDVGTSGDILEEVEGESIVVD
jgi:hypothetical protein